MYNIDQESTVSAKIDTIKQLLAITTERFPRNDYVKQVQSALNSTCNKGIKALSIAALTKYNIAKLLYKPSHCQGQTQGVSALGGVTRSFSWIISGLYIFTLHVSMAGVLTLVFTLGKQSCLLVYCWDPRWIQTCVRFVRMTLR
ncbi:hypothetical protein K0M31_016727 [Melipona bicolor]|uniref:Uncharacterized protein n=1 Tax=Melipona bicolor TaxID=60889 RepID=A0AA40FE51_9HYME|nr:hypothetical protein K0M31_016727 [Melipona bicolor]